jgi:hypothetical protein
MLWKGEWKTSFWLIDLNTCKIAFSFLMAKCSKYLTVKKIASFTDEIMKVWMLQKVSES